MSISILGIESSCDDTSAAVLKDGFELSNVIANQDVHKEYGGVVPELASRAHQQNIIPVVDLAIKKARISKKEINAVAFTRGPGLLGSLLVGASFAKGFSISNNIPIIDVNHLHGHILVHFIKEIGKEKKMPSFPFLCLLVSGGHSQIVLVQDYLSMQILGQTIDDAAGEAFDKCAKVMGFPYPGGPVIDKLARDGNPHAFKFNKPRIDGLNYSFSGFKTSFLYFFRNMMKEDRNFVENFKNDICASIQFTIIDILLEKLILAAKQTGIHEIAIAGGVSANSGLRETLHKEAVKRGWKLYIPEIKYTTDNAAMIAITGFYKFIVKKFASQTVVPVPRIENIQDTYF